MDCVYELINKSIGSRKYRCHYCGHIRESEKSADLLHRECLARDVQAVSFGDDNTVFGLGDHISQALSLVGITEERVSAWLGHPCKCKERRERLNQLGRWVTRVLSGKTDQAKEHLEDMIGSEP